MGPAGCGKTHHLLDAFEKELTTSPNPLDESSFFILPSAEHTERIITLMVQKGIPGFFHRRITTFSHLLEEVFGVGKDGVASNMARFMILRDLFTRQKWEYFEEVQESPGFLNLMAGFIDELKESCVSAEIFRNRMNELKKFEPELASKYEALAKIYESYEDALAQQGLRDRHDTLSVYRSMKKAGYFKTLRFKNIWMDGFFDFSNAQLESIRELAEMTDNMVITLTQEASPLRADLFEVTHKTEQFLSGLGFKVQGMKAVNQRSPAPALTHLEKNLFAAEKPSKKMKGEECIGIFEAIGMEGEIEMIAREIERLRQTESYRYSDFAILLRQIGGYGEVIRSVFNRFDIPVEIHERERLEYSPLIRTLTHFFKIFQEGWKRSDLLPFLKSSYVRQLGEWEKNEDWISEIENWSYREGISQGRENWLNHRSHDPKLFSEDFYQKKNQVLMFLAEIENKLRSFKKIKELNRFILHMIRHDLRMIQVEDSLEPFVRRDAASASRLEAILDEVGASYQNANQEVDFSSFLERFFRLIELDLYSLHQRDKNCVQVYDVSLARQKEYPVVFVAGLLEKGFPVQIKEDPILSDWERQLFNGNIVTPLREKLPRQNIERYLFYLAVTRAQDRLYLTYPRLDLEGQESLPSYYVEEVRGLFESVAMKTQDLSHPYPELDYVFDRRELETAVVGELWSQEKREETEEHLLLYLTQELLKNPETAERMHRIFYEINPQITDAAILKRKDFNIKQASPTKLEEYGKCPFLYFANRVLQLKDPEEEINIMLKGIILHGVLQRFFEVQQEHPEYLASPKKIEDFITQEFQKQLVENPLIFERKYQLELELAQLRETLDSFLQEELAYLRESPLKPRYFEMSFGFREKGSYPLFPVKKGNATVSLMGRIDRIDVDAKHKFGLVADYKSSAQFKKSALELGTALQLPIYLKVMQEYLKLKPVGGEIISIKEHKHSGFYQEDNAVESEKKTGRQSVLNAKDFDGVIERSLNFVDYFLQEIEKGKIDARPRDSQHCKDYCSYASVCRIEKWKLELMVQDIKEEDKKRGL